MISHACEMVAFLSLLLMAEAPCSCYMPPFLDPSSISRGRTGRQLVAEAPCSCYIPPFLDPSSISRGRTARQVVAEAPCSCYIPPFLDPTSISRGRTARQVVAEAQTGAEVASLKSSFPRGTCKCPSNVRKGMGPFRMRDKSSHSLPYLRWTFIREGGLIRGNNPKRAVGERGEGGEPGERTPSPLSPTALLGLFTRIRPPSRINVHLK